ncbi:hypothetical protein DFJ74DRAFT_707122 [Hyaloraphidium curvatum]|nr:hypothetical protein DFJ74DRAFT_707122 [Hyaloraphidium curvatum]
MQPSPVPVPPSATQAEADACFASLALEAARTAAPDSCSAAAVLVSKTRGLLSQAAYEVDGLLGPEHAVAACFMRLSNLSSATGGTIYLVGPTCKEAGDGTSCTDWIVDQGAARVVIVGGQDGGDQGGLERLRKAGIQVDIHPP